MIIKEKIRQLKLFLAGERVYKSKYRHRSTTRSRAKHICGKPLASYADACDVVIDDEKSAQCFSNINLGSSGEDTERPERFWNASTVELKFGVECLWLDAVWKCQRKPNLGMQNLDPILEEHASFKLKIVGPLIDCYLTEIGRGMYAKLGRSRNTGLMPPIKLLVPYPIFRHVCNVVVGYGGSLSTKKGQMLLKITDSDNAGKVFSPVQCKGDNLLRKRHFDKVRENGRNVFKYSGRAAVVVTNTTPIIFEYSMKQEKLTILFYVQRYDKADFSLDASLQALLNRNHVE